MSVHGLYLDINKVKIYMPLEIYFYFLCLIRLSPSIIYLLHIKMLYFAFSVFFFELVDKLLYYKYTASRNGVKLCIKMLQ